jgi:autophagy-related protein 2
VIPSERTKLFLKVMDGSVRAATSSHPGALVIHLGDLEFSTNIVGASPEKSFHLSVSTMSSLFLDDAIIDSVATNLSSNANPLGGVPYWKVHLSWSCVLNSHKKIC